MILNTDFYKVGHKFQYPPGTNLVFSNLTARKSRIPGIDSVLFFGLQYYTERYLREEWNREFFDRNKHGVVSKYKKLVDACLQTDLDVSHIEALWDLGYLPLAIYSVPEGTRVPIGVPMLVVHNTHPDFAWLTNYIETSMSATLWPMCTSATIAAEYRRILLDAAERSGGSKEFVDWQGHDFSYRGMFGEEAAAMSGAGHLLSFNGTDTIPAIGFLEDYYGCDTPLIAGSVPATEHSVMCMGGQADEKATYERLLDTYPTGIVSVVSDTWDYWKVLTETLPALKDKIMARDGKLVIRPDSGDPVKIIAGDDDADPNSVEFDGSFLTLYRTFPGPKNREGVLQLDPHIGLIYGDSITLDRCREICNKLIEQNFVPNMVFGIGSYTYQYVTRDTFGFAIKATYGEVNGEPREIFKNPKTDDGTKKSAKGIVTCRYIDGKLQLVEGLADLSLIEDDSPMELKFKDGDIYNLCTHVELRKRVRG